MFSGETKKRIYALVSIFTIILIIGSFALIVNFLAKTNDLIFSVDEMTVKEKTTVLDKANFEKIKEKMELRRVEYTEPVKTIAPSEPVEGASPPQNTLAP